MKMLNKIKYGFCIPIIYIKAWIDSVRISIYIAKQERNFAKILKDSKHGKN
jgi:hypothetical protein